jgi:hypothetical protein
MYLVSNSVDQSLSEGVTYLSVNQSISYLVLILIVFNYSVSGMVVYAASHCISESELLSLLITYSVHSYFI